MINLIEKFKRKYLKVTIRLSNDRSLFYPVNYVGSHDFWLSYEKTPGPVPENKKSGGLFDPSHVEIQHENGQVWHRELLPFTFWKVSSNLYLTERISYGDDRIQDYLTIKNSHESK